MSNPPRVLNRSHFNRPPPNSVFIGLKSIYSNPFIIGIDGTREEVIARFEREIIPTLDLRPLRGKNLVCFCAPKACHGDVLLAHANKVES